jgi:uncharacterized protein YprB with RNaseH-like and TPR domain
MTGNVTYKPIFFDIETTGLNPLAQEWHYQHDYDAQVFAVTVGYFPDFPNSWDERETFTVWNTDEYELLEELREKMCNVVDHLELQGDESFLVGYNSRSFDHPYLVARYSRKRQNPFPFCYERKRLDMMNVLYHETGKHWKEDEYAEHLGIEVDDEYTGKDMPDAFANREWQKIFEHVKSDVNVLMDMFLEEKEMFMQGFYDHYDIERDATFVDDIEL